MSASEILSGLKVVPGVVGSCLFDLQRRIIAHELRPPYEAVLLASVLERFDAVQGMHRSLEGAPAPRAMLSRFSEGLLSVRWFASHTLVVLAGPAVNPAMLLVASNALQARLEASPPASEPPSAGMVPAITAPALTPPTPRPVPAPGAPALQPQASTSFFGAAPEGGDPSLLPVETLRNVASMLARHVGPLAQALVKRDVDRMGYQPRTFPRAQVEGLIGRLATNITDPVGRQEFVTASRSLVGL